MNIFIVGSNEITPEYRFISNVQDTNDELVEEVCMSFDQILNNLTDTIYKYRNDDVILITRGSNSGIDAMTKIWADINCINLIENRSSEDNNVSELIRDMDIIKKADMCVVFPIKYENLDKNNLSKVIAVTTESGIATIIYSLEKYS